MDRDPPRLMTLDIVRGLAILMVVAFHLDQATGIVAFDALRPVVRAGWAGVDLFFVLSGFLVGGIILGEARTSGRLRRRRFFVRRMLRLWPALYHYLAVLLFAGGLSALPMVVPVLLNVQNYVTTAPSHLWSLAVEEHFYLAAAFVLPWLVRGGERRVFAALIGIMLFCLMLRTTALLAGESLLHAQWQTQYRIDALAMGVWMAAVKLYRPATFARLARRRLLWSIVAIAVFAVLVRSDGVFRYGPGLTLSYLGSAALLLAAHGATVPTVLTLPARAMAGLGTIAYSLYIWHASIARVVEGMAPAIGPPALVLACKYAAAIGWAVLMFVTVERPAMRLRDRRHGAPPIATLTPSTV